MYGTYKKGKQRDSLFLEIKHLENQKNVSKSNKYKFKYKSRNNTRKINRKSIFLPREGEENTILNLTPKDEKEKSEMERYSIFKNTETDIKSTLIDTIIRMNF